MAAVISWVTSHSAVLAALAVALVDFLVEVIPSLKGNNLVGLLLGLLKKAPAEVPPGA